MRKLLIGLVLLGFTVLQTTPVSAHVLVTDESHSKGAILHIIPDDDPIAGQESILYFDTQTKFAASDTVSLSVTDTSGSKTEVKVTKDGSLATANHTFPVQGVYDLQFTVKLGDKTYIYNQAQRVSRGTTSSALDQPSYGWSEMLLLVSILGFAVLAIVAFNNRKDIAKHSKFK